MYRRSRDVQKHHTYIVNDKVIVERVRHPVVFRFFAVFPTPLTLLLFSLPFTWTWAGATWGSMMSSILLRMSRSVSASFFSPRSFWRISNSTSAARSLCHLGKHGWISHETHRNEEEGMSYPACLSHFFFPRHHHSPKDSGSSSCWSCPS